MDLSAYFPADGVHARANSAKHRGETTSRFVDAQLMNTPRRELPPGLFAMRATRINLPSGELVIEKI